MTLSPFVHLHVHSAYSLLSSTLRVDKLVERAKTMAMPAVALTDQGNLFAAIQFYSLCLKSGIKPLLGAQVYLVPDRRSRAIRSDKEERDQLILLCRNGEGWKNLMRLVSIGHLEGSHGKPRIDYPTLAQHTAGLIALSGGSHGSVSRLLVAGSVADAEAEAHRLVRLFDDGQPNFYLELQRHGLAGEEGLIQATVALAHRLNIPLVATGDVHFMEPGDLPARDALFCIGAGRTLMDEERPRLNEQYAFYSGEEMARRFADLPEALANTYHIATRCNVRLQLGRPVLPDFQVPAGHTLSSWLRQEAGEGLRIRLDRHILPRFPREEWPQQERLYRERLDFELDVILQMGFPGYFLIVSDFIKWAKSNGVPVGPGRGSGAGSLAAYSLQITDLDPLRFQLLFERFLNPERVSMPDFDVDFCMDRRDRVIEYVQQKYGKDRVAGIITYGTLQARAVVRDVARVLEFSYSQADRIAKLIPFVIGITLDSAIKEEERLQTAIKEDGDVANLITLAKSLEGLPRSAGTHAAGIVMSNGPLTDMVPLYLDPRSTMPVTQFYMGDAEKVGLVKFDFLGLKTLTVIQDAVDRVNSQQTGGGPVLDITTLDLDDRPTFALLKEGKTLGVFQLESSGMREILRKLAPDTFEDIVALVALYRPGPLGSGMVDEFIDGKHGRIKVEYPLPQLEPILKETYGVILYQEQVMQIAQVLAGYSLGGADLLRRAMGKKKPQEMASQRAIFMDGCNRNQINAEKATHIFDLMEKFAGYGFNKSHSAAYALISYQTAWLKAHHPLEFMAATLTCDMIKTDKVMRFIRECRAMGLRVEPPNVNLSEVTFASREQAVWYGLAAIKNVGEAAMAALVKARKQGGAFVSLYDLCRRLGTHHINKRVLENLIKSGACDCLGGHRAALMEALPGAMSQGIRRQDAHAKGFRSLFDDVADEGGAGGLLPAVEPLPDTPEWSDAEQLAYEKDALGFYLTSHPLRKYEEELNGYGLENTRVLWDRYGGGLDGGESDGEGEEGGERWVPTRYEEPATPHRGRRHEENRIKVVVAGIVADRKLHRTRKGERMAFFSLEDRHGQVEAVVFPEAYNSGRDLLEREEPVVIEGSVEENSADLKILVDTITDLDGYRAKVCSILHIEVDAVAVSREFCQQLETLLSPHVGGDCRVLISLNFPKARALLRLGEGYHVYPRERLLTGLQELVGRHRVRFFRDRTVFNAAFHWPNELSRQN